MHYYYFTMALSIEWSRQGALKRRVQTLAPRADS